MKRKILMAMAIILIILILGLLLVVNLNRKEPIVINDVNNVSTTKKLDINIYNLEKNNYGYNVTISIKNNSGNDLEINSVKIIMKDKNNKLIAEQYFNIHDTIKNDEEYVSNLLTEHNLNDVSIIDYELVE